MPLHDLTVNSCKKGFATFTELGTPLPVCSFMIISSGATELRAKPSRPKELRRLLGKIFLENFSIDSGFKSTALDT